VIDAGAGDDIVIAGDGDDQIAGGSGDDLIQGDFDWETAGGSDLIDAGDGNDIAIGGAGDDLIAGGAGDDTLYGDYRWDTQGGGDDVIAGGQGDDVIYGGSGNDTAVFAGSRDQYEITQNSDGSYTVTDLVSGRDGTDRIFDIESIRFSDGEVSVSDLFPESGGGGSEPGGVVYPVDIDVSFDDASGSVALAGVTIDLSNVPDGVVFSAGTVQDGALVLTPAQLENLTMTVPDGTPPFQLQVGASLTDLEGGGTYTTTVSLEVGGEDYGGGASSSDFSGLYLEQEADGAALAAADQPAVEMDISADGAGLFPGEAQDEPLDRPGIVEEAGDRPAVQDDYMALAEPSPDAAEVEPGSEAFSTDYTQFAENPPEDIQPQEPPIPEDMLDPTIAPVADDTQPSQDAGDAPGAEPPPDQPPAWDQDDH